jgi:glycosyltransferase involved in cell wall biosynthesis
MARITKGASVGTLAASLPALGGYGLGLRRQLKTASLVYLNTAKALLYGTAANLFLGKPVIFHLHDLLDETHFSPLNLRLLVGAANRADAVIANSQATADAFVARGGRSPVHVIPNGFDPAVADAVSPSEVEALRREFNPEGRPVIAIFGRLARWKGQDVLLRAAECLPGVTLWIVGDALFTGDDHAYAEELRAMAATLKAQGGDVRFLGFRSDIPALMKAADIVAHCSVAPEPFGRVLVEAMLAGKPLIASKAGGPTEIVADGTTGVLVPPGDHEVLATAIRQLVDSPSLRSSMGLAGRDRASQLYALPTVLDQTAKVIDSVLKRK